MKRTQLLCILALSLALILASCSAGMDSGDSSGSMSIPASSSAPTGAAQGAPQAESVTGGASGGGASGSGASGDGAQATAEESAVPLPLLTPSNSRGKRIVYTVDVELQTTAFMVGIRTLLNTVSIMDGYVESANVRGRDLHQPVRERSADYTLRLYSENLPEFLVVIEDNYNLVSLRQTSEDVTARYGHGDSSLSDLRSRETRLLRDLENTQLETDERLEIELQLAHVQTSIRNYERQQAEFDDGVLYSTINVKLYEVIFEEEPEEEEAEEEEEIPEPTFGERFSQAASRSMNSFIAFCQTVLIILVRLAPALLTLIVLTLIALFIYRTVLKYRKKRNNAPDAPTQSDTSDTEDPE